MLTALILALVVLGGVLLRLLAYRRQLEYMARVLEETPAESNLCLTVWMDSTPARRLCRAVNRRLEEGRRLRLEALDSERKLKYTMACVSHDIRTPLAGAMGYLQLLEGEPERQAEYLDIVQKRLTELDRLLDELFLYTRLANEPLTPACGEIAVLPPLEAALAEFYPQLEAAGITPELRFDREDQTVWASAETLGRVYRNLIANAIRHGGGGLSVIIGEGEIVFCNPLGPGPAPDPKRLFDRFYRSSPAREKGGAGLGLAIVRELVEWMGGEASAEIEGDELRIKLTFFEWPGKDTHTNASLQGQNALKKDEGRID